MTSLMQGFAQARQSRLQQRNQAIDALNTWRKQRSQEFQQEVNATHALLDQVTSQRITWEQNRLATARSEQAQRLQAVADRASAIYIELQQLQTSRLKNADLASRQRLQEVNDRALEIKNTLAKLTADRLATALFDRTQRLQALQTLKNNTAEFLQLVQSDRLAIAAKLKQELSDYVTYIHLSVWGVDYSNLIAESRSESNESFKSTVIAAPITISIDQFIENYVAGLEGHPTLTQVVNDRNIVKDLLTTGANTLGVDPSEILNTLIKLVDLDN
ncbi:hypothetical protein Syn7502_00210 [Synechococcus sp. PCC 7502]|uniref:hypothetical protein n=1 Tax=Synechococcus sp. PCC 7502 TaxID=1173263 RepID=UPI00029F8C28|nr:hypothetical protein [Synechococcus sp. PCC 7502]AFY72378.1 hypothetical protein Syn7502_00210 [Synechococcus sp. PCC 7502]